MQCQMLLSKKLAFKGNLRQVVYLPEALLLPSPLTHCIRVYSILDHTGKGEELTRDKFRGAIVHKAGRKYQHD